MRARLAKIALRTTPTPHCAVVAAAAQPHRRLRDVAVRVQLVPRLVAPVEAPPAPPRARASPRASARLTAPRPTRRRRRRGRAPSRPPAAALVDADAVDAARRRVAVVRRQVRRDVGLRRGGDHPLFAVSCCASRLAQEAVDARGSCLFARGGSLTSCNWLHRAAPNVSPPCRRARGGGPARASPTPCRR